MDDMKASGRCNGSNVCCGSMLVCARRLTLDCRGTKAAMSRWVKDCRGGSGSAANPVAVAASLNTDVGHHRRSFSTRTPIHLRRATMKLSWGLFFSSLYCTASADVVSPETARLIIAQRLGLSRFHSIEHADAEAIRQINAYGGRQQKLFGGDDADQSKAHLLMWLEDGSSEDASGTPPLPGC